MFDFERFCKAHNIPILLEGHHHCHAGWVQTHCPLCSNGRGWHLGFNLTQGNFNCWRCGPLKLYTVVGELLRTKDKQKISATLREFQTGSRRVIKKKADRPAVAKAPDGLVSLRRIHKTYLRKRGFNPKKLVDQWGLQATLGYSGPWSWRIVSPICDEEGTTVAYVGRSVSEKARPKYKISDDKDITINPRRLLYGIHAVPGDAIAVVEGVSDVWKMGPGSVGTMGIDWTPEQANELRKYKRRYIIFDPEPLAQRQAIKLAEWLCLFPGVTEVVDGLLTDPGDMDEVAAAKLMRELDVSK